MKIDFELETCQNIFHIVFEQQLVIWNNITCVSANCRWKVFMFNELSIQTYSK